MVVEPILPLYPYQQRWVEDHSRFKIGMFSRQTGKTFAATAEIARHCLEAEIAGTAARWVILSRGERQAKEAMEVGLIPQFMAMQVVMRLMEINCDWGIKAKAYEITLPRGSRITALPANPDTARGFSANVLLDEFAFHFDSHKIWQALFPVISAGKLLRVISTPNGKNNKFYDLMTDPSLDGIWSRNHICDIHQAVADGLPRDIEELRLGINDQDAWAQEYELQWLDEASAWLSYDLIEACEHPDAGDPSRYRGGPCFIGVDIGARHDLFVIWVIEIVGEILWTREIIARQRISFAEQDDLLAEVFARYKVIHCSMDQSGMGEKPVEDAKRRYGDSRIEGVLFTGPMKLTLATIGKAAFETQKLRIPLKSREIRADLHKLQKILSPTGAPRFVAESDAAGHADRAWSCFLAVYAADSQMNNWAVGWTPAPGHDRGVDRALTFDRSPTRAGLGADPWRGGW